ncbi:Protein of unknown function [Natronincola peptidivorans]|uniref:Uncharacterized protein n=1 Tax=Natronincola peptidivorans TaxID=426128 RepID=A0A1H9Y9H1_9FIRM|nr:DUF3189 family protein [Natronincola peptidivorans]SES65041.1 Protein of unknown function [Natronincola peptidivorans]
MKIVYAYKKNIYAAYRAAYLHLSLNPQLIPKSRRELMRSHENIKPYYLGIDEDLNEIYIASCGRNYTIFQNAMEGIGRIYGEEVQIILIH